jgi:hypothetical protein
MRIALFAAFSLLPPSSVKPLVALVVYKPKQQLFCPIDNREEVILPYALVVKVPIRTDTAGTLFHIGRLGACWKGGGACIVA